MTHNQEAVGGGQEVVQLRRSLFLSTEGPSRAHPLSMGTRTQLTNLNCQYGDSFPLPQPVTVQQLDHRAAKGAGLILLNRRQLSYRLSRGKQLSVRVNCFCRVRSSNGASQGKGQENPFMVCACPPMLHCGTRHYHQPT